MGYILDPLKKNNITALIIARKIMSEIKIGTYVFMCSARNIYVPLNICIYLSIS